VGSEIEIVREAAELGVGEEPPDAAEPCVPDDVIVAGVLGELPEQPAATATNITSNPLQNKMCIVVQHPLRQMQIDFCSLSKAAYKPILARESLEG
jgi:hypothetical protein